MRTCIVHGAPRNPRRLLLERLLHQMGDLLVVSRTFLPPGRISGGKYALSRAPPRRAFSLGHQKLCTVLHAGLIDSPRLLVLWRDTPCIYRMQLLVAFFFLLSGEGQPWLPTSYKEVALQVSLAARSRWRRSVTNTCLPANLHHQSQGQGPELRLCFDQLSPPPTFPEGDRDWDISHYILA